LLGALEVIRRRLDVEATPNAPLRLQGEKNHHSRRREVIWVQDPNGEGRDAAGQLQCIKSLTAPTVPVLRGAAMIAPFLRLFRSNTGKRVQIKTAMVCIYLAVIS
jgi:hypothetical protein